jgi:NAD(P)-dependent dehydrogenase (short-subunit alcohol dehydrogenase family)
MGALRRREFFKLGIATGLCVAIDVRAQTACSSSSTAEEVTRGLELAGQTAVVTGCNSGIGYETMRVLALRGARVIGTARTMEKGREACASIVGSATPVVLELTDFESVVACAKQIRALTPRIDMLILNAGIVLDRHEQVYGLEKQFVVNHLGHFLLTNRVLDLVTEASQGRVVTVGSGDHRKAPPGGIQFDDLSGKGWSGQGYAHSKLANGLFSLELARRLTGRRATSNCLRPGHVRTNILRNVGNGYLKNARTIAQGSATVCYAATNPALAHVNGQFFADCNLAEQSAYQQDRAMAARLWDVSAKLVKNYSG